MEKTGEDVVREALRQLGLEIGETADGFRIEPKDGQSPVVTGAVIAERNELLLLAHVGYVTVGREAAYRALLQYHYLGLKTNGATFALDPLDCDIVAQRFYPLAGATADEVAGLISAFVANAAVARDIVEAP